MPHLRDRITIPGLDRLAPSILPTMVSTNDPHNNSPAWVRIRISDCGRGPYSVAQVPVPQVSSS